jgi:hypothetical protein
MHMARRCAVDQQAQQFRAAVVTARIHHAFSLVDQAHVEVDDHLAFAFSQRALHHTIRADDCGEATTGNRADGATGIGHEWWRLLLTLKVA